MSIQEVTQYRTNDGQLHDSKEEAREHIENEIRGVFDKIVRKVPGIGLKDIHKLVDLLYENRSAIERAFRLEE